MGRHFFCPITGYFCSGTARSFELLCVKSVEFQYISLATLLNTFDLTDAAFSPFL
jgi:hypothetical protein